MIRSAELAVFLRRVREARGLTTREAAERARYAVLCDGAAEGRPRPERWCGRRLSQCTVSHLETSRRALAEWAADKLAAVYRVRFEGLARVSGGEDFEHPFLVPGPAGVLRAVCAATGAVVVQHVIPPSRSTPSRAEASPAARTRRRPRTSPPCGASLTGGAA